MFHVNLSQTAPRKMNVSLQKVRAQTREIICVVS